MRPSKETNNSEAKVTASHAVKIKIKKAFEYKCVELILWESPNANANKNNQASSLKKKNRFRSCVQVNRSSRHEVNEIEKNTYDCKISTVWFKPAHIKVGFSNKYSKNIRLRLKLLRGLRRLARLPGVMTLF